MVQAIQLPNLAVGDKLYIGVEYLFNTKVGVDLKDVHAESKIKPITPELSVI